MTIHLNLPTKPRLTVSTQSAEGQRFNGQRLLQNAAGTDV